MLREIIYTENSLKIYFLSVICNLDQLVSTIQFILTTSSIFPSKPYMNIGFLWSFHIFQNPDDYLSEQPLQPNYHYMELQLISCLRLTAEFLTNKNIPYFSTTLKTLVWIFNISGKGKAKQGKVEQCVFNVLCVV